MTTMTMAMSFHQALDTKGLAIGALLGGIRPSSHTEQHHLVVRERDLSYRFTAHYHPWVTELTKRLLAGSTTGLEAADTEFRLRVVVAAAAAATTGASGVAVTLAAGETVDVSDESGLTVGGELVQTAGRRLVRSDGTVLTAAAGAAVSVPAGIRVVRAGGAVVELTGAMSGTLVDGAPRPSLYREIFAAYQPDPAAVPNTPESPHPVEDLDFSIGGAYSGYNWELFFHVPYTIAVNLSRAGRYAEAMQWLHLVFDPTTTSAEIAPERYWRVKPFQTTEIENIQAILLNLSTHNDPVLRQDTVNAIQAWRSAPFRPHVVARYRPSAYMLKTVFAYLDNLVAWGDSLFRQDTGETIDEARQLYVLAAVILGPRPQSLPQPSTVRTQNYAALRGTLDEFSNAERVAEGTLLFDLAPAPDGTSSSPGLGAIRSIGRSLYFGVPRNDMLMSYWDKVADRLFKIRNSLNLQGTFRQLPLFEPPIDPALLARATAAGLSTAAAVAAATQPPPMTKFTVLLRQAGELAQQVASLGTALLSALEKSDGESLTLLRARHERALSELAEQVKYGQVQEAVKSREALLGSLDTAVARYAYYERQLGAAPADIAVPQLDELDVAALAAYNLRQSEPTVAARDVPVDIATDLIDEAAGRLLNRFEASELDALDTARTIHDVIKIATLTAQGIAVLPDFGVKFHFWGLGGDFLLGGTQLSRAAKYAAEVATTIADMKNQSASMSAKIGAYARREQDWAQQSALASKEIGQVFKQLRAAQIREAVATTEWRNHRTQLKQLAEVEEFLNADGANAKGRVANDALYAWLKRDLRSLYDRAFSVAVDAAAKAESALQYELGDTSLRFVGNTYLAGNQGLLAGEKLQLDLKRMELAYHENNVRELEVTRHISLAQVAPLALLTLRATGTCEFDVPEELLDLEGPGHYFRRLRSVSLSVPCVVGPFASVNCRLTLTKHAIRTTDPGDLVETNGTMDAIVASGGNQDAGIADLSGQDGRRLPFELAGAVSSWQLDLPGQTKDGLRTFDYDTISDVILHLRFTARQGNPSAARERLLKLAKGQSGGDAGRVRLFSLRHEFGTAWAAFTAAGPDPSPLSVTLTRSQFPYWAAGRLKAIEKAALYRPPASPGDDLELLGEFTGADVPKLDTPWTQTLEPVAKDLWLLVTWHI